MKQTLVTVDWRGRIFSVMVPGVLGSDGKTRVSVEAVSKAIARQEKAEVGFFRILH